METDLVILLKTLSLVEGSKAKNLKRITRQKSDGKAIGPRIC